MKKVSRYSSQAIPHMQIQYQHELKQQFFNEENRKPRNTHVLCSQSSVSEKQSPRYTRSATKNRQNTIHMGDKTFLEEKLMMEKKFQYVLDNMFKGKNNEFQRNLDRIDFDIINQQKKKTVLTTENCGYIRKHLGSFKNTLDSIKMRKQDSISVNSSKNTTIESTLYSESTFQSSNNQPQTKNILDKVKIDLNKTKVEVLNQLRRTIVREECKKLEREAVNKVFVKEKAVKIEKQTKLKKTRKIVEYNQFNKQLSQLAKTAGVQMGIRS